MRGRRLQDHIKGRRDHLGLSQEDVAALLDISARAYGNWERGVVKEWTDEKLFALAAALQMNEYQTTTLFWIAVDRPPQRDLRAAPHGHVVEEAQAGSFLGDYRILMEALSLPTFVIDHRWDVKMANQPFRHLFSAIREHPTAMPTTNFLRFGLFHPDAHTVFADHTNWRLSMLAQLASSLARHDEDGELQSIRREVWRNTELRDTYFDDMPAWLQGAGVDLVHHDGSLRTLRHPDPTVGLQRCRLVEETPHSLQALGLTRITLVLVDPKQMERVTAQSY
jgi:transcriptional regulator with XRE-family HTH domain